ncbi:hypothetical protein RhiirA5_448116 [Rhizophagus irregularis]|uniref:HTH CENPB-type domain-containing protein n=1 Tax=Rhizophagus irregularis TaxID=588596 RepID=A0A2N0NAQ9_9GLOM|nr:hypothetical protein RhiirA5_448116 [Rhizophagus irregularis]
MTATVKAYLEGYFLSGNANKTDRISAKDMVKEFQNLAKLDDVPEIKTVEGWIARFSSSLRKEYATQRIAENNNNISAVVILRRQEELEIKDCDVRKKKKFVII